MSALKIVFLLGFLILIHETGHLLVAKLCKVKVNEFAIGFGPTIWKHQGKETKYAFMCNSTRWFFVVWKEKKKGQMNLALFQKASIPRRIAIVAAGATVNILFGLIVYFILMSCIGMYAGTEKYFVNHIKFAAEEIGQFFVSSSVLIV